MVKNLPAMQETRLLSLGQKDALENGMATRSSLLAWRTPWKEEPGGLQSMGWQRVRHDWATEFQLPVLPPLSIEFSRQEYWSRFHLILQEIFLTQGWKPHLLCLQHWQADSLPLHHLGSPNCMFITLQIQPELTHARQALRAATAQGYFANFILI